MSDTPRHHPHTVLQPPLEELTAGVARALSERGKLQLQVGSNKPPMMQVSDQLQVSALPPVTGTPAQNADALRAWKGEVDIAALMRRLHSPRLHFKLRPTTPKAAAIYDALEAVRVEAAGAQDMAGVRHDISARYARDYELQGFHAIPADAEPPLADVLSMLVREKLTGEPVPDVLAHLTPSVRAVLDGKGAAILKKLAGKVADQDAFARAVYELFDRIGVPHGGVGGKGKSSKHKSQPLPEDDVETRGDKELDAEAMPQMGGEDSDEQQTERQQVPVPTLSDQAMDKDAQQQDEQRTHLTPNWDAPDAPIAGSSFYRVYTDEHDQVVLASELAAPDELDRLRAMLDQKLVQFHGVTSRLASRLQRLLMAQQLRHWEFEQEDGMIDSARLMQVIVTPDFPYYYKLERETDFKDTVVTLLLDNSGSMRGRPITVAALSADILARTLERCGIKVEILGFTTRDWRGGMARKDWVANGSPAHPGRLNDLRHIIYKSADQRWLRGRRNLGLMLKDGILKENIDGEAILWAHSRLQSRTEERKILMVISDGAPVDDSTLSVNSGSYLDLHLREVIAQVENRSDVELLAIGIGHDVTRYYKRAVTLTDVDQLGDTMVSELTRLFAA